MTDLLSPLIGGAFLLLLAGSIRAWLRHRGPVELAVIPVFGCTAGVFVIAGISALLPDLAPVLGPVALPLLMAQPIAMVRLAGVLAPMPRAVVPVVLATGVAALAAFLLGDRDPAVTLALVGWFVTAELVAVTALVRDARRRLGIPRARLLAAATGTVLFGLSIFVAGAGAAVRDGAPADPGVVIAARLLALVAGAGYLAAFLPPAWLRELGRRALAFDLVRATMRGDTTSGETVSWDVLAAAGRSVLGTPRVRVVATDPETADAPAPGRRTEDGLGRLHLPIHADGRRVAELTADLGGRRPLFLEDDLALLEELGTLTARAMERDRALVALAEARRAAAEAAALRASEARVRALLDAHPNAALIVDEAGVLRWTSAAADRLLDPGGSGLVHRRLDEVVAPAPTAPRATDDRGAERYESVATTLDGRALPVEVAITPLRFEGEPARLVVVTDIAWRIEAGLMRDRFIGVLSHELRTPITAIYGGTQVLLGRPGLDAGTARELLTDVAGEAERLERMIENLLVLAKVERGADPPEPAPVLVARVVADVVARERSMLPTLRIETDVAPGLPIVRGDEASVRLVLRNLLSNAAKYAGPAASILVEATRDPVGGGVTVRVCDDGPGIEPDEAEALFGLYVRSRSATAAPGSGIGLFVCRQLVEGMGGRVWAGNVPSGGGEFGFTLPPYAEPEPVSALAHGEAAAAIRAAS